MKAGPRKGLVSGLRSGLGIRLGTDGSWGEQGRVRVRAGSEVQLAVIGAFCQCQAHLPNGLDLHAQ